MAAIALGATAFVGLAFTGKIAPWTGRLYSLWDTSYASKHIPIIASVSEHQPTAWTSFFFDLHWLVVLLPAGIYLCFKDLKDEHVFIILYAVTGSYFASVMVRLMLTLTPVVCVAAAIALSKLFDVYVKEYKEVLDTPATSPTVPAGAKSPVLGGPRRKSDEKTEKAKAAAAAAAATTKKSVGISNRYVRGVVLLAFSLICVQFVLHCTWVTSNAYSSPSVVLASTNRDGSQYIIDDFREAYYWLRQNTPKDTKVRKTKGYLHFGWLLLMAIGRSCRGGTTGTSWPAWRTAPPSSTTIPGITRTLPPWVKRWLPARMSLTRFWSNMMWTISW